MSGKNGIKGAINRYLFICFGITYISWGAVAIYSNLMNVVFNEHTWMLLLYIIGVISPAIAAILVEKFYEQRRFAEIVKEILRLPVQKKDWAIGLVAIIVLQLLPYLVLGGKIIGSFLNLIVLVPMFFVIGGLEEIGWRGFWLKRELQLNANHGFWKVLKIGFVWQLWHLPLFFMLGTYQQLRTDIFVHTLSTLAIALLLGGLYIKGRSTFLCIAAHSLINSFSDIVVTHQTWWMNVIMMVICAIFYFIMDVYDKRKNVLTHSKV